MKTDKPKRGGYRPGSGRKKEGKVKRCYSLPKDIADFLKSNDRTASSLIEEAVRNYWIK